MEVNLCKRIFGGETSSHHGGDGSARMMGGKLGRVSVVDEVGFFWEVVVEGSLQGKGRVLLRWPQINWTLSISLTLGEKSAPMRRAMVAPEIVIPMSTAEEWATIGHPNDVRVLIREIL